MNSDVNSQIKKGLNIYVRGSGIFSHFMQFIRKIYNNADYNKYEQIRMLIRDPILHVPIRENIFDYIFYYKDVEEFDTLPIELSTDDLFLRANLFPDFKELKKICSKFTFHEQILRILDKYIEKYEIDESTLAIHVRLTDMNSGHPEHGIKTIDTYLEQTLIFLKNNPKYTKIYIASDNLESVNDFKNKFPEYKISYYEDITRCGPSSGDNYNLVKHTLNDPYYYLSIFLETLLLTKCGAFIHRISGLANFAILFSNSFKEIICI